MKNILPSILMISCLLSLNNTQAQTTTWGNAHSRTESRDNAGLKGNAGALSGFYEALNPVNYPPGASSWWHLLDVRHSNVNNNYAMQLAGSFFDQNLWFRKTNGSATQPWSKVLTSPHTTLGTAAGNTLELLRLESFTGNSSQLRVLLNRYANGADWTSASTRIQCATDGTNQGYIDFNPNGGTFAFGMSNNELLRLMANGNVGIGTTTPNARLHISKSGANASSNVPDYSMVMIGGKDNHFDGQFINFKNPSASDANGMAWWSSDVLFGRYKNTARWAFKENHGGSLGQDTKDIISATIIDNGGRSYLDKIILAPDSGSVGIGTIDTKGYRLAVNGNAIFTGVKVKQYGEWPDYVFDADYGLPLLEEVETYINTHKHLPDVPSAKDIKEGGLDLGENQAILLKKIKELTLYVIQQQKEIMNYVKQ